MRDLKEIQKEIDIERKKMNDYYVQAKYSEEAIDRLEKEWKKAKEQEDKINKENIINNYLLNKFGIKGGQVEAKNNLFIVFDKECNIIKIVKCGYGEEFHYVSPDTDKDTLEFWLRKNKYYAHSASSFCDRNLNFYQMTFKEQLNILGWEFDNDGSLKKTQW